MPHEKRTHDRVQVTLAALCLAGAEELPSEVTNLGAGGCFVSTVGKVPVGESVHLNVILPGGGALLLGGKVVHGQWPLGFGLQFTDVGEDERRRVKELIERGGRPSH